MSGDGEERDVRDSLSELERRLRELERELRTASSEDAQIAAGAPAAPPAEPPAPAVPEPVVPEPVAPEPVSQTPETDPELTRLAAEARRKVAALRESLDGLERASDRLRETAQTMVEDHGRTLVRLERVSATRPSGSPPAQARVSATSPPGGSSGPAQQRTSPAAQPASRPRTPAAPPPPHHGPGRTALIVAGVLGALALLGLVIALFSQGGGQTPVTQEPALNGRVLVVTGVPALVAGSRSAPSTASALLTVCSGAAPAAVVTVPAASSLVPPCASARVVLDAAMSAPGVGLPVPRRGGGRTCVAAPAVDALVRGRRDAARTAARRGQVARAETRGSAAARLRGASAAAQLRAGRAAGAAAATRFDRSRRLRLLAVSSRRGGRCVSPTTETLASGTYPLGRRIRVVAAEDALRTSAVRRATASVREAFTGPLPVDATVLRAR